MKIALFSNFLNHHQLPLCEEFLKHDDVEFVFVACSKIPAEREKMGYKNYDNESKFVVKAYEDEKRAEQIALTFDVCIFGADSEQYVEKRMTKNLLTFRYIERIFKKGKWRYVVPKIRKRIQKQYLQYKNKKFYILCASGFTSSDLSFCGFPPNKCLQWGYFPKQSYMSYDNLAEQKSKTTIDIVYVGRLLKLKRVDTIIKAFSIISKDNPNLYLNIIGDGPEMNKLRKLSAKKHSDRISFLGFKSIDETRRIMEKSHILVFASNFYEGWGAVVNESMSSACIPICSHSVGSTPVLIKDGITGYVFNKGDYKELAKKINIAVSNISNENNIAKNAYESIHRDWNERIAVDRFYKLCTCALDKTKSEKDFLEMFSDGLCARSKQINNNWYRRASK